MQLQFSSSFTLLTCLTHGTQVRCLNESRDGSFVSMLRPFAERADRSKYVDIDTDEQLLIFIPFVPMAISG